MRATVTDRVHKTSAAWVTPGVGRLIALPRAVADLMPLPVVLHFKPAPVRTRSPLHFPLSPSPRTAPCPQQAPPLPTMCRHPRARLPPRKRVAQSVSSLGVVFSTLSTSPSGQSSLGKGESSVFFHRRHGCPRQSWRSTRPAVLAPLPSLLCLTLGSRSAAEACRVTLSGYDAVSIVGAGPAVAVRRRASHHPL